MFKELISAAAMTLTLGAFYPYIRGIVRGTVKPHVFSWVIWGMTTLLVFLAQLAAQGGPGAWAIGVSASITLFIAALAYTRRGDVSISRQDWLFFGLALASLPLWHFTSDPLWAVVVLTLVDLLGFGTLRKAYAQPHSESLPFYTVFLVRNGLVILALQHYSATTVLFPAAIGIACAVLITIIAYRRRILEP